MAEKLSNLLSFDEFDYDKFTKKGGKENTKRTETSLDVINEDHLTDPEDKKDFIVEKLDDLSDDVIDQIYLLIENEIGENFTEEPPSLESQPDLQPVDIDDEQTI